MTTKELLYVEDALGHEKHFETQMCEIASKLSDPDLRNYVTDLSKKHQAIFDRFYGLL